MEKCSAAVRTHRSASTNMARSACAGRVRGMRQAMIDKFEDVHYGHMEKAAEKMRQTQKVTPKESSIYFIARSKDGCGSAAAAAIAG